MRIAKAVVRAKLVNSGVLLSDYRRHYPSEGLASAGEAMREAAEKVAEAAQQSELLGREGSAAAAYFSAFAEMNRSDLPFDGRRKHPAMDPINGLLSLGYTLAMKSGRWWKARAWSRTWVSCTRWIMAGPRWPSIFPLRRHSLMKKRLRQAY